MVRVNFTDTEKYGQSSLGLDPLPTGKYHVAITDVDERETGPNSKIPGSPMWNIEFTVQSGEHQGRKVWTNAVFMPHALYTIKGIMEALGMETTGQELDLEIDDLMNKELAIKVNFVKAGKVGDRELDDRNEVKRFYKLSSESAKSGAVSGGSLLP